MAPFAYWDRTRSPEDLSRELFQGTLVIFRDLDSITRLVTRAREILCETFGGNDFPTAEQELSRAAFLSTAARARRAVAEDETANAYWRETLRAIGYSEGAVLLDRIRLRVVPSEPRAHGRFIKPLAAHRDTWGSGIRAQVNWWLPIHTLAPNQTMVIWPEAFRTPVENDSSDWDYDVLTAARDQTYPLLPTAKRAPNSTGVPVLINPGELLAFSAAHLHASASTGSCSSRFSVDTRTVWSEDLDAERGAPNVDGSPGAPRWEWFHRERSS